LLSLKTDLGCLAIRVRPPLEPGQPGYELIPQRFQRSIVQVISNTSLTVESPQGRRNFIFDRVFNEHVGQEGVFEWVKESIEMFVTGYNVSLLAYGQSGAGKSYTMGTSGPGEQNDPWQMGISPRVPRSFLLGEGISGSSVDRHRGDSTGCASFVYKVIDRVR
jgi:Kinesin motor domain